MHGGLSLDEIKEMTLTKAMSYGQRIYFDILVHRPDMYLRSLMDSREEFEEISYQFKKTTQIKIPRQKQGFKQKFYFPKSWV